MSLSDREITTAIKTGELRVRPSIARLNPAGMDLRVHSSITLLPKMQKLVATFERVELSETLVGTLHIRSSLAREGVIASLALVDPGFKGQLTISLYNAGDRPVRIVKGERFIQMSLLRLGAPATQSYNGKYQNSRGVVGSRRGKRHRS